MREGDLPTQCFESKKVVRDENKGLALHRIFLTWGCCYQDVHTLGKRRSSPVLTGCTRRGSMENAELQIALEELGGFPWAKSSGWGRMGIYGCQTIHAQKDQRTLGLEKTILLGTS